MAGLDLTAADSVLKEFYHGLVREQLNNANVIYQKVKKNTRAFSGKRAYIPLHVSRNTSTVSLPEDGTLPTADAQGYDDAHFYPTYHYGQIRLTGPTIYALRNDRGGFIRALNSEMKGLMIDMKIEKNRQVLGDGTGNLTDCGVTSNSTTVVVNSTKYLQPGMRIQIRQKSDGQSVTSADDRTVVSVDSATTFTISGAAVTTDADDAIYRYSSRNSAAWGTKIEAWGIDAIVSASNPGAQQSSADGLTDRFGDISRTGNTWWQASELSSIGTLALDDFQQALDLVEIASGELPGIIVTSHAVKRKYASLLTAYKRYPPGGEITLDGGYKALEYSGVPMVADPMMGQVGLPASVGIAYCLSLSNLEILQMKPPGWMDKDGAVLYRDGDKDAYQATFCDYAELAADRCNTHVKMSGITV